MDQTIGFIGAGNMGGAMIGGIVGAGLVQPGQIVVSDVSPRQLERVREEYGVRTTADNAAAAAADVVFLAVKPQYTEQTLAQCGDALEGKTLVSIVAGITAERLRGMCKGSSRILRTMPNAPAMVFEGAFALCSDNDLAAEEMAAAEELFGSIGTVEQVPEHLIDAVCGLSGGGPAYVAMFIEAMADGGVKQGLPRAAAYRLAAQTCLGTAKMILDLDIHPGQLKDMVTSPGGTTIEGCEALEKGGMRGAVMECINVATEKSKRL